MLAFKQFRHLANDPTHTVSASKESAKSWQQSSAPLALLALTVFLWSGLQLVSHRPRCPSICYLMLAEHRSYCAPPPSWLCHKHWMQESGRLITHLTPAMFPGAGNQSVQTGALSRVTKLMLRLVVLPPPYHASPV